MGIAILHKAVYQQYIGTWLLLFCQRELTQTASQDLFTHLKALEAFLKIRGLVASGVSSASNEHNILYSAPGTMLMPSFGVCRAVDTGHWNTQIGKADETDVSPAGPDWQDFGPV